MSAALIFFVYVFVAYAVLSLLRELVPLIPVGIGWVLAQLWRMVAGVLWGCQQAAGWIVLQISLGCSIAVCWMARQFWRLCCKAVRGGWEVLVFLYFIADEALHPGREIDEETVGDTEEPPREEPSPDLYMQALGVLGLNPRFTQEEFNRAYKRAIARAHPDKGGTHEQALAVNAARATVLATHDWRK